MVWMDSTLPPPRKSKGNGCIALLLQSDFMEPPSPLTKRQGVKNGEKTCSK